MAILINLLLVVDKADSKKGELLFVISIEQSLILMVVLYLAGTVCTEKNRLPFFYCQLVIHF